MIEHVRVIRIGGSGGGGSDGGGGVVGTWIARSVALAAATVLGVVMFVFLSGIVLVGLVLALVAGMGLWIRSWFRRQTAPNGMLDGRRNVRVVRGGPAAEVDDAR